LQIITEAVVTATINTGFLLAIFSGEMVGVWNFVNAIQLIAFIPMLKPELPEKLANMMIGLLNFELMPSVFDFIMDEDDFTGDPPFQKAQDFGYDNAVFAINGGDMLTHMAVLL